MRSGLIKKCAVFFFVALFLALSLRGTHRAAAAENPFQKLLGQIMGVIFPPTITPEDLHSRYASGAVRILLVPGHDNEYPGTEYRDFREADLTREVARLLSGMLAKDSRFVVSSARDFETGEYVPELAAYFEKEERSIRAFREESRAVMEALKSLGFAEDKSTANHGFAVPEVSDRLYGMNKWSNENDIDIVLNLHFNDYPRKNRRAPGKYEGFAIYVPESQYPNAGASMTFARSLSAAFERYLPVSNLPFERAGIVEDQELIAVGSNATREGVSLLIEYGYIYETKFASTEARRVILPELAHLTYRGIKNYFEPEGRNALPYETSLLPYRWEVPLEVGARNARDVFALQAALREEGLYPPPGKSFRECPMSGAFGSCTKQSVELLQEKYSSEILEPVGLYKGTGAAGVRTLAVLNRLYGAQ